MATTRPQQRPPRRHPRNKRFPQINVFWSHISNNRISKRICCYSNNNNSRIATTIRPLPPRIIGSWRNRWLNNSSWPCSWGCSNSKVGVGVEGGRVGGSCYSNNSRGEFFFFFLSFHGDFLSIHGNRFCYHDNRFVSIVNISMATVFWKLFPWKLSP